MNPDRVHATVMADDMDKDTNADDEVSSYGVGRMSSGVDTMRTDMAESRSAARERSAYLDGVMRRYLRNHPQPARFALAQYRCRRRRCRLAWIMLDPATGEPFVAVFGHRYSPEAADRRTARGQREWPDHAQPISPDAPAVQLACDHVHGAVTAADLRAAYDRARETGGRVSLSYSGTEGA